MFWRLCSIVLLALASLRVNAASLTDVIVTNEAAGSPVVKVAVVHEAPATNPSASDDLGRFTRQEATEGVAEASSGDRPDEIGDHKWNSFPKLIFDR